MTEADLGPKKAGRPGAVPPRRHLGGAGRAGALRTHERPGRHLGGAGRAGALHTPERARRGQGGPRPRET